MLCLFAIFAVLQLTSSCSLDTFNTLYKEVSVKRDGLASLVANASATGIDCSYEFITLNVTDLFLNYSLYDINNTDTLCKEYTSFYGEKGCDIGKAVPCRELNKTLDILNRATMDLVKLTGDKSLSRRAVPLHNFKDVKEVDGYFYSSTSMQPLFAGGYDHGDYAFYYGFESDVVRQLKPVGQDSDEVVVHIATLLPTEGTVNNSEIDRVVDTFNRLYSFGLTSGLVLGCDLPNWVLEKYPEIDEYGSSSCQMNTDDPAALELWKQGLTPLLEKLKSNPALNSYRLGNEVFFILINNPKTKISNYTISKWHQWLMSKYGNISHLNKVWKKQFNNFNKIDIPEKSTIGSAPWYDYCSFNGDRIFDYYYQLIKIIKNTDSVAKTHIKYVNHELFAYYYCNGVDRIALNSNLTEWSGCDTRSTVAPNYFIKTPYRNPGQYAFDWLSPAIGYTWMRTTTPDKPVVDLETHPITTSKFRNGSIPNNHMSAVTWLIHLHGIALHMSWAWPRNGNGSYKFNIVDSYPTLPQAVDGYSKTLSLVNALSSEVLALAKAPKPVCILWSRDSSIQDMNYLHSQVDTFEALSFYGPQPQFIAEPLVKGPETFTDINCKVLVIPGQSYVSDEIVSTVQSYVKDHKGNVIFTGNQTVFQFTPIGDTRASSELEWMKGLPHFPDQDPRKLLQAMESYLAPADTDRIVTCVDPTSNTTVWGLICRGATIPDTKSTVVVILNVLTVPVQVSLYIESKPVTEAKDMYMFETIDLKKPFTVEPIGSYVFQIN